MRSLSRLIAVLLLLIPLTTIADADNGREITERDLGALSWRAIGPTKPR